MLSETEDVAPDGDNLTGRLLIAMPNIGDPRFERSVIYMIAHGRSGARGLIVNRLAGDVSFADLLEQLDVERTAVVDGTRVRFGGPVEMERGFVLHSPDYHRDEATLRIDAAISMTATIDVLKAMARGDGPERALFALGYAGWGPGQLEAEIVENGWLHCDGDADIVFGADDAKKWTRALAKIGVSPSTLSTMSGSA